MQSGEMYNEKETNSPTLTHTASEIWPGAHGPATHTPRTAFPLMHTPRTPFPREEDPWSYLLSNPGLPGALAECSEEWL